MEFIINSPYLKKDYLLFPIISRIPVFVQKTQNKRKLSLWISRAIMEGYLLDFVKEQETTLVLDFET